jgi:hypothetical protein
MKDLVTPVYKYYSLPACLGDQLTVQRMKQQTESPDNVGINVTEMVTMVELTLEF